MKAFVTGSRVYGTPREDSDIDLAVFVTIKELNLLCIMADEVPDVPDSGGEDVSRSLRFGKLNLLCFTDETEFQAWREATDELIQRCPATREDAVRLIQEKCHAARNEAFQDPPWLGDGVPLYVE